jgi:hypothetical protein
MVLVSQLRTSIETMCLITSSVSILRGKLWWTCAANCNACRNNVSQTDCQSVRPQPSVCFQYGLVSASAHTGSHGCGAYSHGLAYTGPATARSVCVQRFVCCASAVWPTAKTDRFSPLTPVSSHGENHPYDPYAAGNEEDRYCIM